MVSANFANFWGIDRQKLAKLAKLAPMDKFNWGSATGGPAVSITSNKTAITQGETRLDFREKPQWENWL